MGFFRSSLHVTVALGDGIHGFRSRGERDTDKFGGNEKPPISSGDGDLVDDFILVERNARHNVRPTLSFTLPFNLPFNR